MPGQTKTLPAPTFAQIVPPTPGYEPFEHFRSFPFQPGATDYSPVNAWWLAEASHLVYGDDAYVRGKLADAGMTEELGLRVTTLDGQTRGGRCVVLEADAFTIVAFRGTRIESFPDPLLNVKLRVLNLADFATDVDFRMDPERHAHLGFSRAFDELLPALDERLERVGPKPVWLTGHSLGAALATVAAETLGRSRVKGLYTFGSPRVGDGTFRSRFDVPCHRYVNHSDVVPHLPPGGLTGDYVHVGELCFFDRDGRLGGDPTPFEHLEAQFRAQVELLRAGLAAYHPTKLIEAGRAIAEAVRVGDLAGIGGRIESLQLDVVPVAALADHAPVAYATRVWNALVAPDR
ncbi:MAG: lipase family protein [Isosphaeraceae bacterium]